MPPELAPGEPTPPEQTPPETPPAPTTQEPIGTSDPTRPPTNGKGAIWGRVLDRSNRIPLSDVTIHVLETKDVVTSDASGRYRIELTPGMYTFRVVADMYRITRVRNVRVIWGRTTTLDLPIEPDENATEETIAVEAEVERASQSAQLLLRKNAAASSDSVGAQDIAKTPDRNAADAIKRVVGASVVDGRYVFVRGLGDRYTNALLNGSPLPSPEPDRQSVPLDMFPTLVMSDLVIRKTFTPDIPGDFAGGSLDIHTREIPTKVAFGVSLTAGFNSESTFKNRLSYAGGKYDWLGIDSGVRALPKGFPQTRVTRLNPDGTVNNDVATYGKALNSGMESNRAFTLPNGSANVTGGWSTKIGETGSIGFMAGAGYSRKFQIRKNEITRTFGVDSTKPGELIRFNDYSGEAGIDTVTWSALGTIGAVINTNNRVWLTGLYSRSAEKEARLIRGFNDEQAADIIDERLRFINRGLGYSQLRGEHRFNALNGSLFEWRGLLARATLSDPDLRETVYQIDPAFGASFREGTQSGQHFFAAQAETTRSIGLDYTQPIVRDAEKPKSIKAGAFMSLRGRSFDARRFRFLRNPAADPAVFRQRPNDLFTNQNIGPVLELEEWTRPTDSYVARYDVYAGYAMADISFTEQWRVLAGPRIEAARQTIDSFDPFAPTAAGVTSSLTKLDVLPALGVVYKATKELFVRAGASQTVARPQLRELAPFVFTDFLGAREVLGNPDLDRTRIWNFDARVEYYPSPTEVLALSFFHKRFNKPIEPVILPTSRGVLSYQNADGATNTGIEIEAKKKLGFLAPELAEFTVVANTSILYSEVNLAQANAGILTSTSRPLAGQSPFVVNLALDWEHDASKTRARVLYNVFGPRISQVGMNGLPDIYEAPRHVVDVSVAQDFGGGFGGKLSIENILDAPYRFTHGTDLGSPVANRYVVGRSVWVTASYTY